MKRANKFKVAAAFILGLAAIFWLLKGLTDLLGGIQGGIVNLIFSIFMFGIIIFSWKRPLWGGIFTAIMALILAVYFNLNLPNIYLAFIPLLLMCAPLVISGLLFIEADWSTRKRE
jgi:signal transduction histidine kinase